MVDRRESWWLTGDSPEWLTGDSPERLTGEGPGG